MSLFWLLLTTVTAGAAQCNVVTTPLSFGGYDPLNPAATTSTATININCQTADKNPQIVTLQLSAGASGTPAQRTLNRIGGGTLLYNIYLNAGQGQVLGDGSAGSAAPTRSVSRNLPWSMTIYGNIPGRQNVPVGVYSDTLTATILW
jgi:spore coat protein U-like protein